jgi:dUTP pyrophosphatase
MAPLLRFKRLRAGAVLPRYMTSGAAGMDLVAALDAPVTLAPGARVGIPTGWAVEIPPGFEGLALRSGVTILNAPGTIDCDYRGELTVLLVNLGAEGHLIQAGDRIAQLVIAPVVAAVVEEVAALTDTTRGAGGFGHTG